MIDIEKIDNILYRSIYDRIKVGDYNEIWGRIKNDPGILRDAVQVIRDKFDEKDIVKGLTICDAMLTDYESVDEIAYNNLINAIYTNINIARIVMNGATNGGFSFLLMSLWNHNLKLTKEQKAFAVNEAMNKIGTTRWKRYEDNLSKKLDNLGISDDNTTFITIDGFDSPIGQKSFSKYMNYMFSTLSTTQAHGIGEFDIRYYILRNPNWSLEEKQKLIIDFWWDDETYDEYLEQWEWSIINDYVNLEDKTISLLEKDYLYEYTYEMLLKVYEDKNIVDRIWSEIQFCKQMHQLRPQQWELEFVSQNKKLVKD